MTGPAASRSRRPRRLAFGGLFLAAADFEAARFEAAPLRAAGFAACALEAVLFALFDLVAAALAAVGLDCFFALPIAILFFLPARTRSTSLRAWRRLHPPSRARRSLGVFVKDRQADPMEAQ